MTSGSKRRNGKLAGVQSCAVFLLLFIYSAGSIQLEAIHNLFHAHEVLHSSQLEKDPCHRAVYHHEKDSCKHKSHVTERKKCPLCQFSFHADQWISANGSICVINFPHVSKNAVALSPVAGLSIQQPSRAPPAL